MKVMQMIIRAIIMYAIMMAMASTARDDVGFHQPCVGHDSTPDDGFKISLLMDVNNTNVFRQRMHIHVVFATIGLAITYDISGLD